MVSVEAAALDTSTSVNMRIISERSRALAAESKASIKPASESLSFTVIPPYRPGEFMPGR